MMSATRVRAPEHLAAFPAPVPLDWRVRAVSEWEATREVDEESLRIDLALRLSALTSREVPQYAIHVNTANRSATTRLDGVLFRLVEGQLSVVRPCAYCGTGELTSPPIQDRADLGRALVGWDPRHPYCQDVDAPDW